MAADVVAHEVRLFRHEQENVYDDHPILSYFFLFHSLPMA